MSGIIASQFLLWIAVIGLGLTVVALIRQIGVLHERVSPMGALVNDRGPDVGEMAPEMTVNAIDGTGVAIGGERAAGRSQLLLFVSPACPICKKLLPIAQSFARGEKLEIALIGDGDVEEQNRMIEAHGLDRSRYLNSAQVGMAFHVGKLPYAILIDRDGVIRAKGLVNSREHLESLAVAEETGYGSIQDYLTARQAVGASQSAA